MHGEEGADTFVFEEFGRGFDVIFDFEDGIDRLQFGGVVEGHDDIQMIRYTHKGEASTLLRYRDEDGQIDTNLGGLVLSDVTVDQLSTEDFSFLPF